MKGKQGNASSNVVIFRKPSGPVLPGASSVLEGLELIKAFSKIETKRDRRNILDLAKRLAENTH
jgi:hypothetical protein